MVQIYVYTINQPDEAKSCRKWFYYDILAGGGVWSRRKKSLKYILEMLKFQQKRMFKIIFFD